MGSAGWALWQRRPYMHLPLRKKRQVSLSSSWRCFCSSFLPRSLSASLRISWISAVASSVWALVPFNAITHMPSIPSFLFSVVIATWCFSFRAWIVFPCFPITYPAFSLGISILWIVRSVFSCFLVVLVALFMDSATIFPPRSVRWKPSFSRIFFFGVSSEFTGFDGGEIL